MDYETAILTALMNTGGLWVDKRSLYRMAKPLVAGWRRMFFSQTCASRIADCLVQSGRAQSYVATNAIASCKHYRVKG